MADWESGNKSRRMILSYDQRIMPGQYPVADLMGYRHTKDGQLVIEPEEAKTVRFIFLAFIQGYNYDQIAMILTQKKRSTLRGRQEWNGVMVANIMKNERRWGDLEARKSIVVDYKLGKVTKNNGNRCSAYVPEHHEAIVSPEIARAAHLVASSSKKCGVQDIAVIRQGALKGFVGIHPNWNGINAESIRSLCLSTYLPEEVAKLNKMAEMRSGKKLDMALPSDYLTVSGICFINQSSPVMEMKNLLLGAAGFIGTNLAIELAKNPKNKLTLVDRNKDYFKTVVKMNIGNINVMESNLTFDMDFDSILKGQDVVYHLVSTTVPTTSNQHISQELVSNVIFSANLFEACIRCGVEKVVFISSGGTVYGKESDCPLKEKTATNPISSYGVQKITIEKLLYLYRYMYGLDYRIIRLANPYGPYQRPNGVLGAVTTFTYKALQGEDITVYGDGSVVRDFIYADAAGNTVVYMVPNYQIDGKTGTWLPYDSEVIEGVCFFMMRNEQRKDAVSPIVVDSKGVFVTDAPNGFENVRSILTEYIHRDKKKQPNMTEHEKYLTNGTYERARESGTEQNYDMIDGCVNNVPKKPRRIGGRWSVLDRLHIKQAERKQKEQPQQQQRERSRKN